MTNNSDNAHNPLLAIADASDALPDFAAIRAEHAEPALDAVLADNRARIQQLLKDGTDTWETLAEPLETLEERVHRVFGPVAHLFMVCSTPEWRAAYNACLPKLTDYAMELGQSRPLFEAWQRLRDSADFERLDTARRATVVHNLRDYHLAGVALDDAPRARFRELSMQLSEQATRFEENVLDCTQAWHLQLPDASRLNGMSEDAIAAAAARASDKGETGYRLTLDFPSFDAVIRHADDRALREQLYTAWSTRASEQGPHDPAKDNGPLMADILAARHEQSQLLGYANYAELSLAKKMADSPDTVEALSLIHISEPTRPY